MLSQAKRQTDVVMQQLYTRVHSLLEHSFAILISFEIGVIFNTTSAEVKTKSADIILKMITILKEMRIAQFCSKSEWTLHKLSSYSWLFFNWHSKTITGRRTRTKRNSLRLMESLLSTFADKLLLDIPNITKEKLHWSWLTSLIDAAALTEKIYINSS